MFYGDDEFNKNSNNVLQILEDTLENLSKKETHSYSVIGNNSSYSTAAEAVYGLFKQFITSSVERSKATPITETNLCITEEYKSIQKCISIKQANIQYERQTQLIISLAIQELVKRNKIELLKMLYLFLCDVSSESNNRKFYEVKKRKQPSDSAGCNSKHIKLPSLSPERKIIETVLGEPQIFTKSSDLYVYKNRSDSRKPILEDRKSFYKDTEISNEKSSNKLSMKTDFNKISSMNSFLKSQRKYLLSQYENIRQGNVKNINDLSKTTSPEFRICLVECEMLDSLLKEKSPYQTLYLLSRDWHININYDELNDKSFQADNTFVNFNYRASNLFHGIEYFILAQGTIIPAVYVALEKLCMQTFRTVNKLLPNVARKIMLQLLYDYLVTAQEVIVKPSMGMNYNSTVDKCNENRISNINRVVCPYTLDIMAPDKVFITEEIEPLSRSSSLNFDKISEFNDSSTESETQNNNQNEVFKIEQSNIINIDDIKVQLEQEYREKYVQIHRNHLILLFSNHRRSLTKDILELYVKEYLMHKKYISFQDNINKTENPLSKSSIVDHREIHRDNSYKIQDNLDDDLKSTLLLLPSDSKNLIKIKDESDENLTNKEDENLWYSRKGRIQTTKENKSYSNILNKEYNKSEHILRELKCSVSENVSEKLSHLEPSSPLRFQFSTKDITEHNISEDLTLDTFSKDIINNKSIFYPDNISEKNSGGITVINKHNNLEQSQDKISLNEENNLSGQISHRISINGAKYTRDKNSDLILQNQSNKLSEKVSDNTLIGIENNTYRNESSFNLKNSIKSDPNLISERTFLKDKNDIVDNMLGSISDIPSDLISINISENVLKSITESILEKIFNTITRNQSHTYSNATEELSSDLSHKNNSNTSKENSSQIVDNNNVINQSTNNETPNIPKNHYINKSNIGANQMSNDKIYNSNGCYIYSEENSIICSKNTIDKVSYHDPSIMKDNNYNIQPNNMEDNSYMNNNFNILSKNIHDHHPNNMTKNYNNSSNKSIIIKSDEFIKTYHQNDEHISNKFSLNIPHNTVTAYCENFSKSISDDIKEKISQGISRNISQNILEQITKNISSSLVDHMAQNISDDISENVLGVIPITISEDSLKDVTKHIYSQIVSNISDNILEYILQDFPRNIFAENYEPLYTKKNKFLKPNFFSHIFATTTIPTKRHIISLKSYKSKTKNSINKESLRNQRVLNPYSKNNEVYRHPSDYTKKKFCFSHIEKEIEIYIYNNRGSNHLKLKNNIKFSGINKKYGKTVIRPFISNKKLKRLKYFTINKYLENHKKNLTKCETGTFCDQYLFNYRTIYDNSTLHYSPKKHIKSSFDYALLPSPNLRPQSQYISPIAQRNVENSIHHEQKLITRQKIISNQSIRTKNISEESKLQNDEKNTKGIKTIPYSYKLSKLVKLDPQTSFKVKLIDKPKLIPPESPVKKKIFSSCDYDFNVTLDKITLKHHVLVKWQNELISESYDLNKNIVSLLLYESKGLINVLEDLIYFILSISSFDFLESFITNFAAQIDRSLYLFTLLSKNDNISIDPNANQVINLQNNFESRYYISNFESDSLRKKIKSDAAQKYFLTSNYVGFFHIWPVKSKNEVNVSTCIDKLIEQTDNCADLMSLQATASSLSSASSVPEEALILNACDDILYPSGEVLNNEELSDIIFAGTPPNSKLSKKSSFNFKKKTRNNKILKKYTLSYRLQQKKKMSENNYITNVARVYVYIKNQASRNDYKEKKYQDVFDSSRDNQSKNSPLNFAEDENVDTNNIENPIHDQITSDIVAHLNKYNSKTWFDPYGKLSCLPKNIEDSEEENFNYYLPQSTNVKNEKTIAESLFLTEEFKNLIQGLSNRDIMFLTYSFSLELINLSSQIRWLITEEILVEIKSWLQIILSLYIAALKASIVEKSTISHIKYFEYISKLRNIHESCLIPIFTSILENVANCSRLIDIIQLRVLINSKFSFSSQSWLIANPDFIQVWK